MQLRHVLDCFIFLLFLNDGFPNISATDEVSICSNDVSQINLCSDKTKTVSHSGDLELLYNETFNNISLPILPSKCLIKIVTCGSCHLIVSVLYLKMKTCSSDGRCSCDYLKIKEPNYEKPESTYNICGFMTNMSNVFMSQTEMVVIEYVSDNFKSAFSLQIKSVENVYKVFGHSASFKLNNTGFIESPYFPKEYPSDYSSEFILENANPNGLVQLTFTDFRLSAWSYVEIFDSNATRLLKLNGNVFRPSIVLSTGPYLSLKFNANEESPSYGFRAQYLFKDYQEKQNLPKTDCGGLVQDHGGTLSMSFIPPVDITETYDCIWIIHPRLEQQETHLSLKVIHFDEFAPSSILRIYEGITSKGYLMETLPATENRDGAIHSLEYIVSASRGFYLRFVGQLTNQSKLAIVYTAFKYGGCTPSKEFHCNNNRCIRPLLRCDGYNHCGDGSDEMSCSGGTMSPQDSYWFRTLTPNYYFPKQESSGYGGTNTLILITSLTGLGMFILTTALILVKLHKQKRDDAVNREVLSTISADVDTSPVRSPFITTTTTNTAALEPPVYDPPPSYDDVIKFYLPPPPTYTSVITPNNPRNSRRPNSSTAGVENSAFVPDTESTTALLASQRQCLTPKLLTVILPARRLLGLDSDGSTSIVQRNSTNETSSVEKEPKNEATENPQLVDLGSMAPQNVSESLEETESSVESTFSSEVCSKCSCKGACSCPVLEEDKKS